MQIKRRQGHPAQRCEGRQHDARGRGELAGEELVLDLQADEQEEDRHQRVVDPLVQREVNAVRVADDPDLRVQQIVILMRERGVRPDDAGDGRRDQDEPRRRLSAEKGFHSIIEGQHVKYFSACLERNRIEDGAAADIDVHDFANAV